MSVIYWNCTHWICVFLMLENGPNSLACILSILIISFPTVACEWVKPHLQARVWPASNNFSVFCSGTQKLSNWQQLSLTHLRSAFEQLSAGVSNRGCAPLRIPSLRTHHRTRSFPFCLIDPLRIGHSLNSPELHTVSAQSLESTPA